MATVIVEDNSSELIMDNSAYYRVRVLVYQVKSPEESKFVPAVKS